MKENAPDSPISALLVGDYGEDRGLVRNTFRKLDWRLLEARDARRALQRLGRNPVEVVIAQGGPAGSGWQMLLDALRELADPPQLVVTSRTADDHLWSEVLNRGGYDVLPQPLDREELERVIDGAARHCRSVRDGGLRTSAPGAAS